ncbi:NAD-dependent epimerase/dehydratase family protein [Halovenus sp. WSH3]|uniref:NAD-dependent epimerase/dehydratase family protein n=1 Tax=Halovenus carboxidivorans TaxID=2692199 RepID=A0A6B0SYI9_9EURY|nr:UDP-glucuronic acid decarboxylase family protein [Halovenus carboxidivorans]MXR50435.1 NAD-dependent epimerase/dehydratase family protein [Halovenus carboxidivorans]
MSRILVTGAAGFLGSYLTDHLLADGHEVIGMDNRVSGQTENLDDAFEHPDFSFYEHDVTEFIHVSEDLDAVMHLASLASPVFYRENPIKTLKVGALGTHKTLGLAKEKDATYLFTSTSEVYGDPKVNPQPEDYRGNVDPYGPRSCYDESKRYGESLVRAYRDQHGLDVRVARIFNTYGPRMRLDDGRVIPNFVKQALTGEDLTVYGDGEQTRSFCYVSDMIDGLVALLESDVQEPVNIGNPDERTINELARVVLDATGSESDITYEELPPQDPQVRRPDISKARSELEWEPTVSLSDGLRESIPYFERQL